MGSEMCIRDRLVILYPIIPIMGKLIVLWVTPSDNKTTKEFMKAQYGSTVAYAIQGSIAAPMQLCYQIWLAINGIVPFNQNSNLHLEWHDMALNRGEVIFPTTGLCIVFSLIT